VKVTVEIDIDDAKADAYNDALFDGPEYDDPVIGDGRALVRDIAAECPGDLVDNLLPLKLMEHEFVTGGRVLLDDEVVLSYEKEAT
jgi:hypothetical protein